MGQDRSESQEEQDDHEAEADLSATSSGCLLVSGSRLERGVNGRVTELAEPGQQLRIGRRVQGDGWS